MLKFALFILWILVALVTLSYGFYDQLFLWGVLGGFGVGCIYRDYMYTGDEDEEDTERD